MTKTQELKLRIGIELLFRAIFIVVFSFLIVLLSSIFPSVLEGIFQNQSYINKEFVGYLFLFSIVFFYVSLIQMFWTIIKSIIKIGFAQVKLYLVQIEGEKLNEKTMER